MIPIARAAGSLKRVDPEGNEEVILYRTMLDLIKPKLVYLDLPLFMALLSDLFPGVELPPAEGGALRRAIEAELREANLQVGTLSGKGAKKEGQTGGSGSTKTSLQAASQCPRGQHLPQGKPLD